MFTETKVRALEDARVQAMLEGDIVAIDAMMADGGAYIHSAGAIDTKQMFMDRIKSGDLDYHNICLSIDTITLTEHAALVVGIKDIKLERSGAPVELHIRYSAVWVGNDDAAQMLNFQATIIPR